MQMWLMHKKGSEIFLLHYLKFLRELDGDRSNPEFCVQTHVYLYKLAIPF